jgi:nicotinamide phosphoribosyltransferase
MGSALLQEVKRDMGNFAFKVNETVEDGIRSPVSKNPATGPVKASKAGRQALVMHMGEYWTIPEAELGNRTNLLRTVYKDGEILIDDDFSVIRKRANESISLIKK